SHFATLTAVTAVLEEGEVVPMLRRYASGNRAGLVVMTTHGRGPPGRFRLGGVADELVRVAASRDTSGNRCRRPSSIKQRMKSDSGNPNSAAQVRSPA